MKIALNILKQYIHFEQSLDTLCEILVNLGFEVEGVDTVGFRGKGDIVVGLILSKEKHPAADRLNVCLVDIGQSTPLQIVCGATNFKVGDRVPVALPGSQLGDITLKKTIMRGIESQGMLCSAVELGVGEENSGLLILNAFNVKIGEPVAKLFAETSDTIIDLSITANRGDCLSYMGIARELRAALNLPIVESKCTLELPPQRDLQVKLSDDACDYYAGCLLKNVRVGPSPDWLKNALQKAGLRSINNVVDVTNFVMLERGQPLHAFDGEVIHGTCIEVRGAYPGEQLKTLDGIIRSVPAGTLLITDIKKPLAIAGIMGGESSEIKAHTHTVFLESAHFKADCIQRTARVLGLSSDSAYRYERFVDKTQSREALIRAVELLQALDKNILCEQAVFAGSDTILPRKIKLDFLKVDRLLGFHADCKAFLEALTRLGFEWTSVGDVKEVSIPSYRGDISQLEDLVEEFLRLCGTHKVPSKIPDGPACSLPNSDAYLLRERHAQILTAHGFFECYTDSLHPVNWYATFVEPETLEKLKLSNPLSEEHGCLRPSLIPGLLNTLSNNRDHGNAVERLFESGHIFKVQADGQLCELFASAFVVCSNKIKQWKTAPVFDFYDLQALLRSLIIASGGAYDTLQKATQQVDFFWQKLYAGRVGNYEQQGFEAQWGYVNLNFSHQWFKNDLVWAAECFWRNDRLRIKDHKIFQRYSEYPTLRKDVSLLVDKTLSGENVRHNIEKTVQKFICKPIQLKDVKIFDVFEEAQDDTKKSLAFSLTFGSNTETLTDKTVNEIFEKLQMYLETHYGYQIRRLTV